MIRTWIKTGAADVLCHCGLDRVAGALMGARNAPVVIGYHRVVEDFAASAQTAIPSLLISLRMLERQLDWIGRRYQFVDLNELGARLEREDSDDPIAAITFDDGYTDFYTHALPLLQRKGIPAAVFVVSDHVGTERIQVHDKLYLLLVRRRRPLPATLKGIHLPKVSSMNPYQAMRKLLETLPLAAVEQVVSFLESEDAVPDALWEPSHSVTWEMLERMQKAGVIVGSHTKTHPLMANETAARMQEEAAGSRAAIEARLGTVVEHFAYPSGVFNAASVKAVAAAGYRFAYTTCTHRSPQHPRLTVPRGLLWENSCLDSNRAFSGSIMSCQVHRAFELVGGCRQPHKVTAGRENYA